MYTTLITPEQLQALQMSDQPVLVFDCSFELANTALGQQQYLEAHIPGAVYAHLDTALSAKGQPDARSGGRHPLPARDMFAAWLSKQGFSNGMQAVVYDRQGAHYCGRLWWMLKWLGHEAVAVLDGGWPAWQAAGGAVASGTEPARAPATFTPGPEGARLATTGEVLRALDAGVQTIVDARATPRYRGEVEPLDPVAGHIPGALNRPFMGNFQPDGRFKPAAQLREEFDALLAGRDVGSVVHHCGSGVTATPNILAMELAGLGRPALYAGSWSEWCSDPARPVAKG